MSSPVSPAVFAVEPRALGSACGQTHVSLQSEHASLDLATVHGKSGAAAGKDRTNVSSASDRAKENVLLDVGVDKVEEVRSERRAGRHDLLQRRELVLLADVGVDLL